MRWSSRAAPAGVCSATSSSLLGTLKGLPSGYNKDLQDDKRALFDAVDTMLLVLPAVAGTLGELTFQRERMRAAVTGGMMATDLADYLVTRGATFREAHGAVGRLVREAEEQGCELDALPAASLRAAHALFDDDAVDWLGASLLGGAARGGRRHRPGGGAGPARRRRAGTRSGDRGRGISQ